MADYQGVDFYKFSNYLSQEENSVRNTVRQFVDRHFLPLVRDHFKAGTFPNQIIPEMGSMGLLGSNIHGPGCPGLSARCTA